MRTMPISEFKAKCIAVLKDAQTTGRGLIVTWRGQPIVRIEPIPREPSRRRLGAFRGRMKIKGDLVHSDTTGDWEVEK